MTAIAVLLTVAVGHSALAQDKAPPYKVKIHWNVPYVTGPKAHPVKHRLDVYEPRGVKNAPVLMLVHGGAWQGGSKLFNIHAGQHFAARGIVTVAINYRLSGEVRHPAHVRDVARAFDWVKKHVAKYGGEAKNVFIAGHSAGGHLVALLALNEKYLGELGRSTGEIRGVIPISGLFRVGATSPFFKNTFDSDRASLIEASPEFHVDDEQPPFLIIYAGHDFPLLDIQAIGLEIALKKRKSPVKLLCVKDRNHITIRLRIGTKDDPTTKAMMDFVRKYSRAR